MTLLLSNDTGPLALTADGTLEVLRLYRVTLHKPGLYDDDGTTEIAYPVEVTLRYPPERAEKRPPQSFQAMLEAATRATKMERRSHRTPLDRSLFVDPEIDVEFLREKTVPARAA